MQQSNNKRPATRAQVRLRMQAEYMIFKLGYRQIDISKMLNVSQQTLSIWARKYNWRRRFDDLINDIEQNPIKFDDSLSAFIAYVRLKHPAVYNDIKAAHKQFLNTL